MGRLPSTFGNRVIVSRTPFVMENRVIVHTDEQQVAFSSGAFLHDKPQPFEVHRMIPRVFEVDDNGDLVIDSVVTQDVGLAVVKAHIYATSREQELTKNPTPLIVMTKGSAERTWEWAEPNTCVAPEGYVVMIDVDDLDFVFSNTDPTEPPILQVELAFEGFLLELGPEVDADLAAAVETASMAAASGGAGGS